MANTKNSGQGASYSSVEAKKAASIAQVTLRLSDLSQGVAENFGNAPLPRCLSHWLDCF
ncbi:hypothetical protein EMIT0P44_100041 [Pseudomonas sp. IT-P44]